MAPMPPAFQQQAQQQGKAGDIGESSAHACMRRACQRKSFGICVIQLRGGVRRRAF